MHNSLLAPRGVWLTTPLKAGFRICLLAGLLLSAGMSRGAAAISLPATLPGDWTPVGRAKIEATTNSAVIQGGYVTTRQTWEDVELNFRCRAPEGAEQVQLWAGFRQRDRDSRYVFALRGGDNNDVYLARYAPDGGSKFLGFAPLDFKPAPGTWYRLRAVASGHRIQIYLNDEALPRLNVADDDVAWASGSILLGGGWLPAEYADLQVLPLSEERKAAVQAVGDQTWSAPKVDKEALRRQQRMEYQPARLETFKPERTELSLDGKWLFLPDQQATTKASPADPGLDDQSWHVMDVPSFWTPGLSWLHGETGFNDLKGVAITKGVASSLYTAEKRRVEAYTFDWRKTKAAWYRQHVELPEHLDGRHFELTFDAIAKISEVWVNGVRIGAHTGMFGQVQCDATAALKPGRGIL